MKILALDTALNACSAAIGEDNEILGHRFEARRRGHAERLMPMLQELMAETGLRYADLDLIAVTVGPGTFTGLRIGLAAARAIALAANKPILGLTTLEVLAAAIPYEKTAGQPVIVCADARRGEVYIQPFTFEDDAEPVPLAPPAARPLDEALRHLEDTDAVMTGSGGPLLAALPGFDPARIRLLDEDANPDSRVLTALAARRKMPALADVPPAPLYLRAPDAKLPGGRIPDWPQG